MPSPIANCKHSVVLLVVSLVLLGPVVPSAAGSTLDIRRQSEDHEGLSKHSTKRKGKKGGGGSTSPRPCFGSHKGHRADITGN